MYNISNPGHYFTIKCLSMKLIDWSRAMIIILKYFRIRELQKHTKGMPETPKPTKGVPETLKLTKGVPETPKPTKGVPEPQN